MNHLLQRSQLPILNPSSQKDPGKGTLFENELVSYFVARLKQGPLQFSRHMRSGSALSSSVLRDVLSGHTVLRSEHTSATTHCSKHGTSVSAKEMAFVITRAMAPQKAPRFRETPNRSIRNSSNTKTNSGSEVGGEWVDRYYHDHNLHAWSHAYASSIKNKQISEALDR